MGMTASTWLETMMNPDSEDAFPNDGDNDGTPTAKMRSPIDETGCDGDGVGDNADPDMTNGTLDSEDCSSTMGSTMGLRTVRMRS